MDQFFATHISEESQNFQEMIQEEERKLKEKVRGYDVYILKLIMYIGKKDHLFLSYTEHDRDVFRKSN